MLGPGSVLSSKYKLSRMLGEGGMGAVYEATHMVLGTRVAVKVLHQDLARRAGLIDRFLQEAMVAARIRSENVVHVMDVERSSEGYAFMVMELLEGEGLSAVLDRARRLDEKTACDYARQILLALEAAHALGVVHRDLKPENVFVTYAGQRPVLKLIDFGIAKLKRTEVGAKNLTVAGVLMGTPEYMAPEQAYSADAVDVRADLYAVGVMLYEMLAGSRPVSGDDGRIIALKVERGEITPLVRALPSVKPEIAGLVHRAMAYRRELRFASATEMRIALDAAQNQATRTGALAAERVPEVSGKVGTGTMMGAPIEAIAAQKLTIDPRLAEVPAGSGTVVAQPGHGQEPPGVASAIAPMAPYGPNPGGVLPPAAHAHMPPPVMVPSAPYTAPAPKSSGPLVAGLVAGSLLLGAAIAAIVVVSGQSSSPTSAPVPPPPLPTTTAVATSDPRPNTPLPLTPPLTPTLTPTPQQPTVPTNPTARPTASPSVAPSATGTVAPTPSLAFPPMPSVLPTFTVPAGWPSVPVIPGFPVPPSPITPTPTASSGY